MKKLIASILTVATVASMASFTAFAADTPAAASGKEVFLDVVGSKLITDSASELVTASDDTTVPDKTLYAVIGATSSNAALFSDSDVFKAKYDKGDDNTKMIKSLKVVDKAIGATTKTRQTALEIKLQDDMTDKEYKIGPSVTFTAKKYILLSAALADGATLDPAIIDGYADKAPDATLYLAPGTKVTLNLGSFYVKNDVEENDRDWEAGTGGWVAKPIKNDDNEITWEDKNDTIAKLTFEGDSDVNKYYPKLSTKWDNADYAENFADTDAFIRSFVGNPTISATSRPVLELYNPFVNEDDEVIVADEDIVIYEVVDGALVDVTAKFTIGENDDGDSVFTLKTRTLGTYIISNGAATAAEEAPAEEPTDVKENPGTGRF